jgi:hypothetical protein
MRKSLPIPRHPLYHKERKKIKDVLDEALGAYLKERRIKS